jgi:hypothetical protein
MLAEGGGGRAVSRGASSTASHTRAEFACPASQARTHSPRRSRMRKEERAASCIAVAGR